MYPSSSDPKVIKAYSHPLRVQILEALETRTASPSDLAAEFGVSVGTASYHVQQLVELGQLRLVDRVERRGALEHFYTATGRIRFSRRALRLDDAAWAEVAGELATVLRRIDDIAARAGRNGDSPDADEDGAREATVITMLFEPPAAPAEGSGRATRAARSS
jgi:DNA-binding transcriptional ArsR family regulator